MAEIKENTTNGGNDNKKSVWSSVIKFACGFLCGVVVCYGLFTLGIAQGTHQINESIKTTTQASGDAAK